MQGFESRPNTAPQCQLKQYHDSNEEEDESLQFHYFTIEDVSISLKYLLHVYDMIGRTEKMS